MTSFALSMSIVNEILNSIAPIQENSSKRRVSYIVIGKPGCGKTTLAEKLAEFTDNQILNIEEILKTSSSTSEFEDVSNLNVVGFNIEKWR
jgi:replication-associated recombination protein RarA